MTTHDDFQDRKNDEQLDLDDFDDAFSPVLEDTEAEDAEADPPSTPAAAQHAESRSEDSAAAPITAGIDVFPPGQELAEAFSDPGLPHVPGQESLASEAFSEPGVPDEAVDEPVSAAEEFSEPGPPEASDAATAPTEFSEPGLPQSKTGQPAAVPAAPTTQAAPAGPTVTATPAPKASASGKWKWIAAGVAAVALLAVAAVFGIPAIRSPATVDPELVRQMVEREVQKIQEQTPKPTDEPQDAEAEPGAQAGTEPADTTKPPPSVTRPTPSAGTFDDLLGDVSELKSRLEGGTKQSNVDLTDVRQAASSLERLLQEAFAQNQRESQAKAWQEAEKWDGLLPDLLVAAEHKPELNEAVQELRQAIRKIKRYCQTSVQDAEDNALGSPDSQNLNQVQAAWSEIAGTLGAVACLFAGGEFGRVGVMGVVQDASPPANAEVDPQEPTSPTAQSEDSARQILDQLWTLLGDTTAYDGTPPSSIRLAADGRGEDYTSRDWADDYKEFAGPNTPLAMRIKAAKCLIHACREEDPQRALLQFCLPAIRWARQSGNTDEERELLTLQRELETQVKPSLLNDPNAFLTQLKSAIGLPADAAERLNKIREIESTIDQLKPTLAHEERISKLEQRLPSPSHLADQLRMLGLPGSLDSRQPVLPPQASDEERQEHEHWARLWEVARQDCTRLQELAAQPERLSARDTADAQVRLHRVTAVLLDLQNHRGAVQVAGRVPLARSRVAEFLQRIESRLQEAAAADATQSAPASLLQKRAEQNIAAIRAALADEPEAAESLSANAARIVQASLSELLADYAELQLLRVSPDAPPVTRESALTFLALLGFPDLDDEVEFGVRLAELQPASEEAASLWAALQADLAAMKNLLGVQIAWTGSQSREVNDLLRNISYAVLRLETPAAQDHAQPLVWSRKVGLLGRRVRYYYAYPGSLVPPIQLAQALRNTQSELLAMIGDRSAEAQRLAEQTAASLQRTQGELSQTRSDLGHVEEKVRETVSRLAEVSAALAQPRELPSAQIEQIGENIESRLLDRLAAHGYPPQKVPAPVPRTEASPGTEDTQPPLPTPVRPGPSSPASRMHAAEIYAAGRAAFFSESNQGLVRATRLFSQSVDLDPDNPIYRYYLGLTLYRQGRYQEALEQVQSGASLESTETYRRGSLGALERIQGPLRVWLERVRLETHALAGSRRTSDDQQPRG